MKNFNFLFFFFISINLIAQDTIVKKRDGSKIICSIIEVNSTITKYSVDSAVFQIANPHVLEIRYQNGKIEKPFIANTNQIYLSPLKDGLQIHHKQYYLNKKKISESDVHYFLMNKTEDKEIHHEVHLAHNYRIAQYTGFIGIPLGLFSVGYYLSKALFIKPGFLFPSIYISNKMVSNENKVLCLTLALTSISLPINSAAFKIKSKKHYENAIRLYNKLNQ
ncbi:MAG: hypothetical protein JNL69_10290 [Bacteroidia bacterium]|nr:hypothetical protein [Bacteroidia bacterium]